MTAICPICATAAHESRFGAPCYACSPMHPIAFADLYFRTAPLFVTFPSIVAKIILPSDASTYPVAETTLRTPNMAAARAIRLIDLLQSPDRRKRKRGMRLFGQEARAALGRPFA